MGQLLHPKGVVMCVELLLDCLEGTNSCEKIVDRFLLKRTFK